RRRGATTSGSGPAACHTTGGRSTPTAGLASSWLRVRGCPAGRGSPAGASGPPDKPGTWFRRLVSRRMVIEITPDRGEEAGYVVSRVPGVSLRGAGRLPAREATGRRFRRGGG